MTKLFITVTGMFAVFTFVFLDMFAFDVFARGGGRSGGSHSGGHSRSGDTHVGGHIRRDGTYVQPHHRTAPNSTQRDNFSSKPNVNPYTGKPGTREPER
jgi:hypothetical protein